MNEVNLNYKPKITVVITVYEDYEYLKQAIESALSQTLPPHEIIIIDDGSKLDTAKDLTSGYVGRTGNIEIKYYKKKNGGVSSARNYGVEKASGDYVAFLDVDDNMLPSNLEKKYDLIKDLNGDYFGVYGGGKTSQGKTQKFSNTDGVIQTHLIDVEGIGIPGAVYYYLFRNTAIMEIGGFDTNLKCNEDYDLLIRLLKLGKKCKGSTGPGYFRNIRKNSLSRPKEPLPQLDDVMKFLKKAEEMRFYSPEHLNYRKMEAYMYPVKQMFLRGDFLNSFLYARKAFKFHKPVSVKQKILYFFSFSFILQSNQDIRQ